MAHARRACASRCPKPAGETPTVTGKRKASSCLTASWRLWCARRRRPSRGPSSWWRPRRGTTPLLSCSRTTGSECSTECYTEYLERCCATRDELHPFQGRRQFFSPPPASAETLLRPILWRKREWVRILKYRRCSSAPSSMEEAFISDTFQTSLILFQGNESCPHVRRRLSLPHVCEPRSDEDSM